MREMLRKLVLWLRTQVEERTGAVHPDRARPEPRTLLRAAEMARESGRSAEALTFYGRAVDAYIEAGLASRAESVCMRIIEMEPKVIRTRYTLAAISVARGDVTEVSRRLADYMAVVILAQAEKMAVPSLLELAGTCANPTIRLLVAEALRRADRPDLADGVEFGTAAPAAESNSERALKAALKSPADRRADGPTPA